MSFATVLRLGLIVSVFIALYSSAFGQYQINGTANQTSCNCYQLTPNQQSQSGSVWNVNQIDLNTGFTFYFDVWLGCNDNGADGMAFVLQPLNVNQGGQASSLGYGGIAPSLVIELDIWPNDVTMSDPLADHIAIMQNGNSNHGSADNLAGPVQASSVSNNIEDCQWHQVRIVWDPGLNTIAVFFDGVYRTSYTGDIINTIFGGSSNVYWGWTGSTGGASADQRFCNAILPDYTITSTSACAGDPIGFQDASNTSSGNISNWSWDFGDGSSATGSSVSHTYAAGGTYDVTLQITTEGCTEDSIIPITIDPIPVVGLGPDVPICEGWSVQLNTPNNLGSGTYSWTPVTYLSDPSAASPVTTPAGSITYTLTYTDVTGCSGSDDILITVNPLPAANAGADQTICEGEGANLLATGGVGYSWTPAGSLSDANVADPVASPIVNTTYTVTVSDANNCTNTDDVQINVVPAPSLEAGPNENICEGDVVQLNATGIGVFSWNHPESLDNTSIQNPVATPVITTVYYVTLTDANNCTATDSVIVDVDPIPVADFLDPIPACDGNPVQFTDNSTGSIDTYSWDFGDGQTGQGANPAHLYAGVGTYDVELIVLSANGCSAVTTGTAQVITGPEAEFTVVNAPDFCEQQTLVFTNTSSGPIATYHWDFGDFAGNPSIPNSSSSDFEPVFSYPDFGDYIITLEVGTADNCFATFQQNISVHPLPETDFTSTPACFGEATDFSDLTALPIGTITGWEWSFGDGSNIEYSQNPSHTYDSYGAYEVTLIAQSAEGCRDTIKQQITVNPTPEAGISAPDVCLGDAIPFTNTSTPNDNTIVQWDWDFGDGQTDNAFEPQHTYQDFGVYTVQLTALTDSGCTNTADLEIEVYPYPVPNFGLSTTEGCSPVLVNFFDESSIEAGYSIGSYEWDFGDGTTSTQASPTHTYELDSIYDVSLILTAANGGCADTLIMEDLISVYTTPDASFSFNPTNATILDPRIFFTNHSVNGVDYDWSFGDGLTGNGINPMHTYGMEGDYLVELLVTNGICSDRATQLVHIDPETFVYIPNTFTPNSDGKNDGFVAQGIGIEGFDMTIFDRWGKILYYTANINESWDGTYMGKQVPVETYVYRINILNVRGETETYCGNVNVIR